jgi:uncharacterized protein
VAYGIEVTPSRLARIERAEEAVRATLSAAGIDRLSLRVRDLGEQARIEIDAAYLTQVMSDARLRTELEAAATAAGFASAFVDPEGFRSGAMNELLADPDRYR